LFGRHGAHIALAIVSVRPELVEAPFFLSGVAKKEQPFDKLRANGK